jgi:hypothetical protein
VALHPEEVQVAVAEPRVGKTESVRLFVAPKEAAEMATEQGTPP